MNKWQRQQCKATRSKVTERDIRVDELHEREEDAGHLDDSKAQKFSKAIRLAVRMPLQRANANAVDAVLTYKYCTVQYIEVNASE